MSSKQDDAQANTEHVGIRPSGGAAAGNAQDQGAQAKRQGEEGHVAESGLHTNFAHAAPDSNVNPPGKPQSSQGSATEPIPGGAPPNSAATSARNASAGPSYGQQVVNSSGGAGMDRDS